MRWFSSLKGKKMKAHTKMVKVEEKRRLQARGVPRSRRTRGRGVYGGKLRALAVCTASIDTLSSVGITFLLSCVFSFTFSSSRSPSKSVGNPQAQGDGLRLAAWSDISGGLSAISDDFIRLIWPESSSTRGAHRALLREPEQFATSSRRSR